jgi:hypothetical protein
LSRIRSANAGHGIQADHFVGRRFSGTGCGSKPEEYATHLLELYGKRKPGVGRKKIEKIENVTAADKPFRNLLEWAW